MSSERTFSRRHLHFVRGESTAVSQFPIVAHSYGKEEDVAGLCLHAVVREDGKHFEVRAQNHVFSQFDLLSVEGEGQKITSYDFKFISEITLKKDIKRH